MARFRSDCRILNIRPVKQGVSSLPGEVSDDASLEPGAMAIAEPGSTIITEPGAGSIAVHTLRNVRKFRLGAISSDGGNLYAEHSWGCGDIDRNIDNHTEGHDTRY